jgi:hypothetical protein
MKLTSLTLSCLLALAGLAPHSASAQDDSVTARKYIRNLPPRPAPRERNAPSAKYLLTEVRLGSTYRNIDDPITYGPFKNNSPYVLTIGLLHTGDRPQRACAAWVDAVQVDRQNEYCKFTVNPNSSYSWNVQNQHIISAWVATEDTGIFASNVGLPEKNDLATPTRTTGRYVGCFNTDSTPLYYYEAGWMSDGSDFSVSSTWERIYGSARFISEFNAYLIAGNPPPNKPAPCKELPKEPEVKREE